MLGACAPSEGELEASSDTACPRFAVEVVSHEFGDGEIFGQASDEFPQRVLGPPSGGGCCAGGLDVTSLGNGGSIVLGFAETTIVDGPGPDFIVFENAFNAGGDPMATFAELGTVGVSEDGVTWFDYPCEAVEFPYGSCAGWHPVLATEDDPGSALDPELAGGDAFDLGQLGVERARFVRVVDRVDLAESIGCCFDLDAVGVIHGDCAVSAAPLGENSPTDAGTSTVTLDAGDAAR